MKTWMKVLLWFGTGFGFGFFVGFNKGTNVSKEEYEQNQEEEYLRQEREAIQAKTIYAGDSYVGDLDEMPFKTATDEEPEMPKEEDLVIDPEIPQLHMQHMVPEIITEMEFEQNPFDYDKEYLEFYEMDEVLYDRTTTSIIEDPDSIIGIGTLFEFGGDPKVTNNYTIFVRNDTYGTLFRIDRLDEAFCDAVDGSCSPAEEDDFWNDGDG